MQRQSFLSITLEFDEATTIDGSGRLCIRRRLIFLLATPSLATVAIFSFVFSRHDLTGALIFLNSLKESALSLGSQHSMLEHRSM